MTDRTLAWILAAILFFGTGLVIALSLLGYLTITWSTYP